MPLKLPPGYLTRPEAAKIYNRSQRALERELNQALALQNERVLKHWKLVTKDGVVQEATDITPDVVNQAVNDGMAPAWCVSERWLQDKYGRKGEERPRNIPADTDRGDSVPTERQTVSQRHMGEDLHDGNLPSHLERIIQFLEERVRTLEREKREEIERNEVFLERLFDQLNVKDQQINSWNEITQGVTRGLATGQLTPSLSAGKDADQQDRQHDQDVEIVRTNAPKAPSASEKGSKQTSQHPSSTKKSPTRKNDANRPAEPVANPRPDFLSKSLPTFARFLRRNRKR